MPPAGAVAGEHAQIVQVDFRIAVGVGDLAVVDLGKPVVGGDGAGVGKDQAAHGIGDGGVFLDAPVVDFEVVVDDILVVEQGGVDVADLLTLLAVEDISLGHVGVARLGQDLFHAVLDIFDGNETVVDLGFEICRDPQSQQVDDGGMILFIFRVEGLGDGGRNLTDLEVRHGAVALGDLIHISLSFSPWLWAQCTRSRVINIAHLLDDVNILWLRFF